MKETILVVEDDPVLLRGLKDNLEFEEYRVITVGDGEAALQVLRDTRPDLILLDLMLPKVNGYEVCRQIRKAKLEMPILMLTAKSQEADIVLGLNVGADEYVTKPFSIKALLARIGAMLRRKRQSVQRVMNFGPYALDLAARRLTHAREDIALTPKEFALLAYLATHAGQAISRDQLLQHVWGFDGFVTGRSVDRCVTTLRAKLDGGERWIKTVREVGYRFEGD